MNIQALRVVRRCVPTLGLALCRALSEALPLRRVNCDNVQLCVDINFPRGYVVALALRNSDRELLSWALDRGFPLTNVYPAIIRSNAATLVLAIERKLLTVPMNPHWFSGMSQLNSEALMDALVQCNYPASDILDLMERHQIDALPRHAEFYRRAENHPFLAAALLSAGVWQPELGLPLSEFFCRTAIRKQRIDALDYALANGCQLRQDMDNSARNELDWSCEAPNLTILLALQERGCRCEVDTFTYLSRWGDLELTQHFVNLGVWPENDVARLALHYQRWSILDWLTSRYDPAILAKAEAIFCVDKPDYLERALESQVWTLDETIKRLAWAKLQRSTPAYQDSREFGNAFFTNASYSYRALHLVECSAENMLFDIKFQQDAVRILPDWPRFIRNMLDVNAVVRLAGCLVGSQLKVLLEHCCAQKLQSLELSWILAESGDLRMLRWLYDKGCELDAKCFSAAFQHSDSEMMEWLDAIDAPMCFDATYGFWNILLTTSGNEITYLQEDFNQTAPNIQYRFVLSDHWCIQDNVLLTGADGSDPIQCYSVFADNFFGSESDTCRACIWLLQRCKSKLIRRGFMYSAEQVDRYIDLLHPP